MLLTNLAVLLLSFPSRITSSLLSNKENAELFVHPNFCAVPNGDIQDACGSTFEAVENTNHRVRPLVADLVNTDFFKYYYLDLFGDNCPIADDSATCGNRACAVDTVDNESDLPEIWRASYLGKFAKNSFATETNIDDDVELSCVTNGNDGVLFDSGPIPNKISKDCTNKNYCTPEDDRVGSDGVYVSLPDNPERYTGYSGPHANMIWESVYNENCFGYAGETTSDSSLEGNANDVNVCIEQRLFYRLISGMHSSVSTHLCYSYLNTTTGVWGPNVDCFMSRVGNHPERLTNLYFNYALVSRAIAKLRNYIDDLQFCPESTGYDQATRKQVLQLARSANAGPHIFNETLVFSTPEALLLKEEFRNRFNKVNNLMDCVGCDRCRLWGKIQAAGYGTALKIVFELSENAIEDPQSRELMTGLRRSELVSLVNTFDRLSKSIEAVEYFRSLVKTQLEETYYSTRPQKRENKKRKGEFEREMGNVLDAVRFVLRSYIDFPKNLWYLFLKNAIVYWNQLIGRDKHLAEERWRLNNRVERINLDL
ncbi:hypothetical protein D0Z00_003743 [Geotrichum galactomycetum]|uniref:Uncharacterized protein n=1 Tax=Geotrichum galactomycetum TaxID=27317 RepID=A0ACB6V0D7_9ASCO|nr:hypothetical protein D0Z00_003743 [Geotrichum candidum]